MQCVVIIPSPVLSHSFSMKHYSNSLTTTVEPFVKLFSAFLKKSTLHNLVIIIWLIGLLLWQKNRNGSGLDTPDVSAKVRNRASWKRTKIMMFFYIHWEIWISKVFGNLNTCIKTLPFTQIRISQLSTKSSLDISLDFIIKVVPRSFLP